ncbi:putative G-protein coupled receptor Mth-like 11 [Lucilia cuprina]|uniref:Putative G-protein coupled receptor Mth-like 11 n=1 Tax=Lucilia cuprina TaxID=7375 RepID=A0A0L0CRY3_LUCCU|nr:putative G-protein coupled receptor Mth-like 11 [Lucilia cuprina]
MGIKNCSYENTINITDTPLLSNGSYIYDNETLIPPDLVGMYNYEILYNGSRRSVPQHRRACICHLKPCITFCSNIIPETYNYIIENNMYYALEMFSIELTLKNRTVVTKNIAEDFMPIVLNEFCEAYKILSPEKENTSTWTLNENGSLMIHSDKNILERNEYCFDFQKIEIDNEMFDLINPKICAKKRQGLGPLEKFNYYLQVLSVIFLILTIIVYCSIPELLNVHGKCLLTYAGCLAMSFSIFSFINLSEIRFPIAPCLILGYLNLFLQLSHFSWLGIISYDIWKSFSDLNYDTTYRRYVKYGFALPFLMILFTYGMQNFDIYEGLKPGISSNRCGLDVYKWSAVLYLYGPCLIILILCMKFFYEMFKIINTNDRELKETEVMLQNDSPNKRYTLFLRLFMMMGISWNLDVLSYILHMVHWKTLSSIVDYINSLQGMYIFINFIVRKRIWNIIHRRYISKEV